MSKLNEAEVRERARVYANDWCESVMAQRYIRDLLDLLDEKDKVIGRYEKAAEQIVIPKPSPIGKRPWSCGYGYMGDYLCLHTNEDETVGVYPASDYDGREPVWLGGTVDEEFREIITNNLNASHTLAIILEAARNEKGDTQ